MLEIGHSHRSSVLILYAWAALFAGAVVGLSIVTVPLAVLIWTTLAAVLALALLSMPKLRWWERTTDRPAPGWPVAGNGWRPESDHLLGRAEQMPGHAQGQANEQPADAAAPADEAVAPAPSNLIP
jgi:UDP-GlcNAc:undecaprenyl-phosphate GlcNAc-1-phosphate transferase